MKVDIELQDMQVVYVTKQQLRRTLSVMYHRVMTEPENKKQYAYLIRCLRRLLKYYESA